MLGAIIEYKEKNYVIIDVYVAARATGTSKDYIPITAYLVANPDYQITAIHPSDITTLVMDAAFSVQQPLVYQKFKEIRLQAFKYSL